MSKYDTWHSHIYEELDFWKTWMTGDDYQQYRQLRLQHNALAQDLVNLLNLPTGSVIKILDVGSGPVSTIGYTHPDFQVELYPVDPLAKDYNRLLDQLGLTMCPRIIEGTGETLDQLFAENTFHIVHSANALDHTYDPLSCIKNMVHVCKPGGWIFIITVQNEGERQQYQGLHQWNLELVEGRVRLWNLESDLWLDDHLERIGTLECVPVDHGNGLPMMMIKIHK